MTLMRRVPVAWTTGIGGAGVSVFYTGETDDITAALGVFFGVVKSLMAAPVTWAIPAAGDKIEATDGSLAGAWTGGTSATVTSTGTGAYVAGTGAYVRWITGAVVDRHKVQGRTFLVPMVSAQFDANGTIVDSSVATIQGAANTLVATNKLVIWHRPKTKTSNDGTNRLVIGAVVPDKVTSLRSRRT